MNEIDFEKITGSILNSKSCKHEYGSFACGYTYSLIDNGSFYWVSSKGKSGLASGYYFNWDPGKRLFDTSLSIGLYGVRPVLSLDSSIIVIGGDGSYENPYTIAPGE